MPATYHVNGPALIYTGNQGASGPLAYLGYTEDGVDISIRHFYDDVHVDQLGQQIPFDLQDMGMDARIKVRLVSYDLIELTQIRANVFGLAEGIISGIGSLIASNSSAFRLVIKSADEPWRFFFCVCRDMQNTKIGTSRTVWQLDLYAWAFDPSIGPGALIKLGASPGAPPPQIVKPYGDIVAPLLFDHIAA